MNYQKEYKIPDIRTPLLAKLGGFTAELYAKIIDQRMTSEFAEQVVLKEAEEPFFTRNDDEHAPVGFWRGEFFGKWLISSARALKYEENPRLREVITASLKRILATSDENGYIGSYKNPKLIYPCDKAESKRAVGFECDFCWNIWCQKYTLWGLIEAYEALADEYLLTAAKKLADQIVDTVHEGGKNPTETGTFFGVASGSIMKPMLILYRYTGDERLIEFAIEIADGFEKDGGSAIKIIKKALGGTAPHTWNLDNPAAKSPERYTAQKAYEMMSCFEGIIELYKFTGTEKYLEAAKRFFDLIITYEYNRLLSVGFNDRFLFASAYEDSATELCDVLHFMRLAAELYKVSGDPKYMDYYEAAFINPFLASVTRDGSWCARAIRSRSHHVSERNVVGMKYNHCCVNNLPRGFDNLSEMIATRGEEGIYINSYLPAKIDTHGTAITISDGYIKSASVNITVTGGKGKTLLLRIPSWSKTTEIGIGSKTLTPTAGEYFKLAIGEDECHLTIDFDKAPRIEYGHYDREIFPITPFLKKRYDLCMPADCIKVNMATVMIGPTLLARSTEFGTATEDIKSEHTVNGRVLSCTAIPKEENGTLAYYELTVTTKKGEEKINLCDFVSASNSFEESTFTIFI